MNPAVGFIIFQNFWIQLKNVNFIVMERWRLDVYSSNDGFGRVPIQKWRRIRKNQPFGQESLSETPIR